MIQNDPGQDTNRAASGSPKSEEDPWPDATPEQREMMERWRRTMKEKGFPPRVIIPGSSSPERAEG